MKSPGTPQLEKACMQQRPNATKILSKNHTGEKRAGQELSMYVHMYGINPSNSECNSQKGPSIIRSVINEVSMVQRGGSV